MGTRLLGRCVAVLGERFTHPQATTRSRIRVVAAYCSTSAADSTR
jgi:hypothetical protein